MKPMFPDYLVNNLLSLVVRLFNENINCDGICGAYVTLFEQKGIEGNLRYSDYFAPNLSQGLVWNRTKEVPLNMRKRRCSIALPSSRMRVNSYHDYGTLDLMLETLGYCEEVAEPQQITFKFPWPIQDDSPPVVMNQGHDVMERDRIAFDGNQLVMTFPGSKSIRYGNSPSEETGWGKAFFRSNIVLLDQCSQRMYYKFPIAYINVYEMQNQQISDTSRLPLCFKSSNGYMYSQVFDLVEMLNILGEDVNATLKQHDAQGIQYTLAVRYHARPKNSKPFNGIDMYRNTCRTSMLYLEDAEVYGFAVLAVALYIAGILMLFMSFLIILEDLLMKLRRLKNAKEERKKAAKVPEYEKMEAITHDMDRASQMSEHRPSNSDRYSPHRGEHGSDNEQMSPGEPNSVTGRENSGNSKCE